MNSNIGFGRITVWPCENSEIELVCQLGEITTTVRGKNIAVALEMLTEELRQASPEALARHEGRSS